MIDLKEAQAQMDLLKKENEKLKKVLEKIKSIKDEVNYSESCGHLVQLNVLAQLNLPFPDP